MTISEALPQLAPTVTATTGGSVLNSAISHLGEAWGRYNCTGFVYTVAYEGGNVFFDDRASSETQTGQSGALGVFLLNNYLTDDPNEYGFVVPITDGGVAQADPTFDNWSLVGSTGGNVTSPTFRDFQPGDLFRGAVTGNNGVTIQHAGVVAAYDPSTNTLWLIDNFIPGSSSSPIQYTAYLVNPDAGVRHIESQFAIYRLNSALTDPNDIIQGRLDGTNVLGGGRGRDFVTGGNVGDTLFGGGGTDFLFGGGADDQLFGGDGSDVLNPGNSTYSSYGGDRTYGGAGRDVLDLSSAPVGLSIGLGSSLDVYYYGGYGFKGQANEIEVVQGSQFNDTISGSNANDYLYGGGGRDRINASGGNDYIRGGLGADVIKGGEGVDRFEYGGANEFGDAIGDYVNGVDRFLFSSLAFGALPIGQLAVGRFIRGLTSEALDADDNFIFRLTDSTLWYDADANGSGAAQMVADLQLGALVSTLDIWIVN